MARATLIVALAGACFLPGLSEARSVKPKVPPGIDAGGIAVALIGGGIDYRRPEIVRGLARDGEGELIGRDIPEDDARPYSASDADGPPAGRLMAEAPAVRLVPVRVASGRHDQIAAALRFVGQTPARIALILADPGAPLPLAGLAVAARTMPELLLVVPARRVAGTASDEVARTGLLVVSAVDGAQGADLMVAGSPDTERSAERGYGAVEPNLEDAAAVSVAALAVRLIRSEPRLSGASLRARILALAKPRAPGLPQISDIARIEWRK